jgi:LPPG:FO 2-phospho-L-lactate transferase
MPGVAAPRCGRFANTCATEMRVVTLAGGTGAAKLLRGLATCVPQRDLTVIGNTGDDTEVWGLHVSPDLDTVTYALGGLLDVERGWGLAGETFNCLAAMATHGADTWFNLGDRDLATHLTRTRALRDGQPLSTVTARLAADLGVIARILPMSDAPVRTMIRTHGGRLTFQEYFVREKALVEVVGVDYDGAASARPAPGVVESIRTAAIVIVCPSNPVTSIGPILAVPGIVDALRSTPAPVVGVSPIVGGAAVSGPAGALMRVRGLAVSPLGVAEAYAPWLRRLLIDPRDGGCIPDLARAGVDANVADIVMTSRELETALARRVLDAALERRAT